jgi:hypothetical protein
VPAAGGNPRTDGRFLIDLPPWPRARHSERSEESLFGFPQPAFSSGTTPAVVISGAVTPNVSFRALIPTQKMGVARWR